ncbi:MAG: hypothetical protein IK092_00295 [Muribaculaceae bacterium]|nr:hypothetical protein [Muribaculaceae bacterium]
MKFKLILLTLALMPLWSWAQEVDIDYEAGMTTNVSSGKLAPYYIASNRGGTLTQKNSLLFNVGAKHDLDTTTRASFGFGAELWAGMAASATYDNYVDGKFIGHKERPANFWVQQLYAEGKYRSLFLTAGAKQHLSPIVNNDLSSGDLVYSTNSRPVMGLTAGFINFQNIPLTGGLLQIAGELGYYKPFDKQWLENHYNYHSNFITTDYLLHYKNFYLRTKPDQPFVVTIGAQAASQFGGTAKEYFLGELTRTTHMHKDLKAFFRTIIAGKGGNGRGDFFVEGNHLGSWDIKLDYKLKQDAKLTAYYQSPWEDGSGIGKLNGFDGLWGLQFSTGKQGIVEDAVIEYIDLTNQGGPIHWAPKDHEGTHLVDQSTGADDYYNNYTYNGYQLLGMSIGSPMVKSPIYNLDGYMRYTDNRIRGFHAAMRGHFSTRLAYKLMGSFRRSWGTPFNPSVTPGDCTALSLELGYVPPVMNDALSIKAQAAMDRGNLYGKNNGIMLNITYHGNLTLKK